MSPFLRSRTARTLAAVVMVAAVLGLTAGPANSWSSTDDTYSVVLDGSDYSNLHDVTAAPDGGSYACGHFRGTVDMDPDPTNTVSVTAASTQPALIVKLDADGNYEWHSTVASTNSSIWGCEVDSAGNVFAVGVFRSSATVGSVTVWTDMGNNNDVAFVAKFASDGTGEWIRAPKRKGGNPGDGARSFAYDIDIDAADNVYVTGRFKKTVDLNLNPGIENYHQAPGSTWYNTFLIKLNNAGNTQWSRSWGGTENTYGEAVVVDGSGNVIVGGWSNPIQMDIDPDPNDVVLVGTPGNDDSNKRNAMLSKFDSSGDLVWGHTFGSNSTDYIYGLAVDASNNIYATGQTGRKIGANASGGNWQTNPSLSAIQVNSFAGGDPYIAKFAPSGDTVWMSVFGGTGGADRGLGIAVSGSAIYSVGEFNQISDFTGGGSTTTDPGRVYHGGNKYNPYLVRHNTSDGSFSCAAALIGNADAEGRGLDLDVNGKPLMSGYFHGSLDFDPTGATNSVASSGQSDGFVARFTTDCAIDAAAPPPSFTTAITAGNTCSTGCATIGLAEGGNTGTISVVLDTAPAGNVVFDVTASDTTEATASPTTLTFTSSNWNTAQTVTLSSVDDDLDDGRQNWTVTVAVNDAASHDAWDSLADQVINGKTTDDDTAGFTLSGTTASVSETGTTDTFTVKLTSKPAGDVVFDISSADTGEATISPAALTFTTGNWNTDQTVTVTGIDDPAADGNQTTDVTVDPSSTADSTYNALSNQTVAVTTADDDSAGVTVAASDGGTTVTEGGTTDTFTVVLNTQPSSDVVINVSSGDTGEATVGPAVLTFTSTNWDTTQSVTVTGVNDVEVDGTQTTTITLSVDDASSDDAYDGVADLTPEVTTADDDSITTTTTTTIAPEPEVEVGEINLVVSPSCSSVTLVWAPGTTDGLQEFVLVSNAPDGPGWVNHPDAFSAGDRSVTLPGLAGGEHEFQILAIYADNSQSSTSDIMKATVADCVVVTTPPTTTTTTTAPPPPPPTTTTPPTTTVPPTTTTPPTTTVPPTTTAAPTTTTPPTTTTVTPPTTAAPTTTEPPAPTTTTPGLPDDEDPDSDGLTTGDENNLGTDPLNPDTDGDGLLDGAEGGRGTDPANPDTDGDGLLDGQEISNGTDPLDPDDPGPDSSPPTTEGQTVIDLTGGDTDRDGLTDEDEAERGTDPNNPDTDGDGLTDGQEVANGTDPLDPDDPGAGGGDDNGGNPFTNPGVLAIAAGLAAAAGLGLTGLGSRLAQFLTGTGWGMLLIAFWRRRKNPTPPRDLRALTRDNDIQFTWVEPKRPKKLDRYSIEGFDTDRWLVVYEHMGTTTHAKYPAGDVDITQWRATATNRHGTSKPSNEVATSAAGPSDKRSGPPIDFVISSDGPLTHLAWSAPTTGGPPEKYVLEGRKDGNWAELLDLDADNTRAAVPTSEVEGVDAWRLRASNEHGIGKPSDEVETTPGDDSGSPEDPPQKWR